MGLISITSSNPEDLFKPFEFPVLPPGKHLFVVANELEIKPASDPESTNQVVGLEARCQDEDGNKGMVVFDNFVFFTDPQTEKEQKGQAIHQARLAQFIVACGVKTPEEIKAGAEFDLAECKDKVFYAISKTSMEKVFPPELDALGQPKKALKASIKQYLYEPVTSEEA